MALHDVVVFGGLVLCSALVTVLVSFWPAPRKDHLLCFKTAVDEDCTPACLKTCHLVEAT